MSYAPSKNPSIETIAKQTAKTLLSYFPPAGVVDQKIFAAGLVELLSGYPQWVIEAVANVRSGLPAHHSFMPSIAEVRKFCEDLRAADYERRKRLDLQKLPPPVDRSNRPTLEELKAKYGPNWGIRSMENPHGKSPPQRTNTQAHEPERQPPQAACHTGQKRGPGTEIDWEF
jgi:hypothetical protein